jgi:hypothetical protein
MGPRRILYFTAEENVLFRSSGSALELEASFSGDEAGVAAFKEHLRNCRGTLFSVLADLTGEDFHEDQIPFLRGSDRDAVLQRRLAQRYRDTRLAAALSMGYVTTGERRNERLLLASFTNTQQFTPWLDALEQAGARLAGVFSVPLLAPALAAKLKVRGNRCLVVTANRAGLRQSFVEDGRLRFSRLERTSEMLPQALAIFVRSETLRLAQYLGTLRALPRDGHPVQVLVVAPPGQRAQFEQVLVSDSRLAFRTVDAEEAVRAAGVKKIPQGTLAEALYLHLAVKNPPRDQFASREDRRRYVVWQLQRGVVAAGAFAFVVCAIVAGARWLEVMTVRDTALAQQREARLAAEQYQRITAAFPVTQTTTENLKLAVVEFRRIAEESAAPEAAFAHVSKVLEQFPQFELDAFNWSIGQPGDKRDANPAVTTPAAAAGAKPPTDLAVLLELSGKVNATQRNDYRGITAQVQRFAEALGSGSGYELVRTQLPFDITSEGTLTGDIGGADTNDAPRFTIVVARRLK